MFTDATEINPIMNYTGPADNSQKIVYYAIYTLGWISTVCWSLSFYPQIYLNWSRKSVVGLSFDFLAFNFIGFLVYPVYVISLLWIPTIKEQYKEQYPNSTCPVGVSDAVFSLHALVLVIITLLQCIKYERGEQKVSEWTRVTLVVLAIVIIISLIVPAASPTETAWTWLWSVDALSYIKVVVTVLKYWPQVLLNYRRKSTEGWSHINVLLDFGGGWVTLVEMFLADRVSSDNVWPRNSQNIIKYWLCVITLIFDSIFLVQHCALYNRKPPEHQRQNRDRPDTVYGRTERGNGAGHGESNVRQTDLDFSRQATSQTGRGGAAQRPDPRGNGPFSVNHHPDDTVRKTPVSITRDSQNARYDTPSSENNCIHAAGHCGYQAKVNGTAGLSDDVSINSHTDESNENRGAERRPMLENGSVGSYGAIYIPSGSNYVAPVEGNPRHLAGASFAGRRNLGNLTGASVAVGRSLENLAGVSVTSGDNPDIMAGASIYPVLQSGGNSASLANNEEDPGGSDGRSSRNEDETLKTELRGLGINFP